MYFEKYINREYKEATKNTSPNSKHVACNSENAPTSSSRTNTDEHKQSTHSDIHDTELKGISIQAVERELNRES